MAYDTTSKNQQALVTSRSRSVVRWKTKVSKTLEPEPVITRKKKARQTDGRADRQEKMTIEKEIEEEIRT